MEANPVRFLARKGPALLDAARNDVAAFVGADPANFVFVQNATAAVNAVVRSLEFRPGDEILTSSLDYNACRNVLREIAATTGAKIVVAEIPFPLESADQAVAAILAAATDRTRLAMIDHVTSNTALVMPIAKIVAQLAARGVDTLVDGAHAPGMLALELEKLGAAYYTGNLHKWVCAPKGAAFLHVRPDKQELLQPTVISHGWNTPRPGHSQFHDQFDWPGSHDPTAWFTAATAIRWLGDFLSGGWPEIHQHNRAMILAARRMLCGQLDISPPCPEEMIGSMATLPMPAHLAAAPDSPGFDPLHLALYDQFAIEIPIIRHAGRRWFRISAHLHNSPDEYRYFAEVLAAWR